MQQVWQVAMQLDKLELIKGTPFVWLLSYRYTEFKKMFQVLRTCSVKKFIKQSLTRFAGQVLRTCSVWNFFLPLD